MDHAIAKRFSHAPSSAPALNRGLAILTALGQQAPRSLENLCAELELPKASVFRLLETLTNIGLIKKTADKRYEPLWQLHPIGDPKELFRQSIQEKMDDLCQRTGCTVEWYESRTDGMRLIYQSNPNTELCVKAQPGFLRDWKSEFEAVARLGHAFASEAPNIRKSQAYRQNGILEKLERDTIQQQLQEAKTDQTAYDAAFNSNGVRRFAAAAFNKEDMSFLGVLAVAEVYHFNHQAQPETMLQLLKTTLK